MQELIQYFQTLEARITGYEARIAALEAEKQAAEARIAALEAEKEKNQRVLTALKADIEELQSRPYVEMEDEDEDFEVEEPIEEEEFVAKEVAEEPVAEAPKVEEPKAEEPKVEKPKVEKPKVEEPVVEEPKAEEPQQELFEEPVAEKEPAAPKAMLYGKPVDDIRLAISLGDRFLYQRELFGQNAELMQRSLTVLNELHSFEEALNYISSHFQWDTESNTYQQFLVTLHRRFG